MPIQPQVGFSWSLFVMEDPSGTAGRGCEAVFNPVITHFSENKTVNLEGCLSIPNLNGLVTRPHGVNVEYLNRQGEKVVRPLDGMLARCFQHEVDHLNGVLFLDHIKDSLDLLMAGEVGRRMEEEGPDKDSLLQRLSPECRGDYS
jgi:peptide deformylase